MQYVLGPLAAQTISGTMIGQLRMNENFSSANFLSQIIARVVSSDGLTARGTLYGGDTRTTNVDELEISTASVLTNTKIPAAGISPVTLTSVSPLAGDYLVLELGIRANNTATATRETQISIGDSGATDLTVGGVETTDLNAWVEFSQDLIFQGADLIETLRPDAILSQTNDVATLAQLQTDPDT